MITTTIKSLAQALATVPAYRDSLRDLLKNHGAEVILFRESGGYEDEERGYIKARQIHRRTVRQLVSELLYDVRKGIRRDIHLGRPVYLCMENAPLTIQGLAYYYTEGATDGIRLTAYFSEAELAGAKADERREELEQYAAGVARAAGVKVNSIDFIKAVNDRLADLRRRKEQWNNPEARMERYAICRNSGNPDGFNSDNDYVGGQLSREREGLEGCLEWLSQQCPLLWAKWEEQQAKAPAEE